MELKKTSQETAGTRGQAAIFDGITFLMLAAFSVTMVYVFLTSYGNSQQNTLANAHVLNYMLDSFKSFYSVEANTLSTVHLEEDGGKNCQTSATCTCSDLSLWNGITVADLLKKDLRDKKLDDKYGQSDAPGLTALRCASNEAFKTFTDGGFSYYVEVRTEAKNLMAPPSASQKNATNIQAIKNCEQELPANPFFVATPFRVFKCTSGVGGSCSSDNYVLKVCLWNTQRIS